MIIYPHLDSISGNFHLDKTEIGTNYSSDNLYKMLRADGYSKKEAHSIVRETNIVNYRARLKVKLGKVYIAR